MAALSAFAGTCVKYDAIPACPTKTRFGSGTVFDWSLGFEHVKVVFEEPPKT